jgi:hypothetical protein
MAFSSSWVLCVASGVYGERNVMALQSTPPEQ